MAEEGPKPEQQVDVFELLSRTSRGALSESVYQAALASRRWIPSHEQWNSASRKFCQVFGLILLLAGVIFFMAFNWADLPRMEKFAILQVLLLASFLGSLSRGVDTDAGRILLFTACFLVGVLVAIVDQSYQVRVQAFTMFLAWTILILPWCLASRTNACWTLEMVLCHATFVAWCQQTGGDKVWAFTLLYALFSGMMVLLWELARSRVSWLSSWVTGVGFAGILSALSWSSIEAFWSGGPAYYNLVLLMAILAALVFFAKHRFELLVIGASSLCAVLSFGLIRVFLDLGHYHRPILDFGSFGYLLIGLGIIAVVAVVSQALLKIRREQVPSVDHDSSQAVGERSFSLRPEAKLADALLSLGVIEDSEVAALTNSEPEVPWPLRLLTGLGAWIASWFLLAWLVYFVSDDSAVIGALGLLVCLGSTAFRRKAVAEFAVASSLAANLAGQLMLLLACIDSLGATLLNISVCFMLLQAILIWAYPDRFARFLFAGNFLLALAVLLADVFKGSGAALWVGLVAAVTLALVAAQPAILRSVHRALYRPLTLAGLTTVSGAWLLALNGLSDLNLGPVLSVLLAAVCLGCLVRVRAPWILVFGSALLALITWSVPGLLFALTLTAVTYAYGDRTYFRLALVGLFVFGFAYYYSLEVTLLAKSGVLLSSGVLLLLFSYVLRDGRNHDAP